MIPGRKEFELIKIYMYICDLYESKLKYYYQRDTVIIPTRHLQTGIL
jgi:hypothetical protein